MTPANTRECGHPDPHPRCAACWFDLTHVVDEAGVVVSRWGEAP